MKCRACSVEIYRTEKIQYCYFCEDKVEDLLQVFSPETVDTLINLANRIAETLIDKHTDRYAHGYRNQEWY